MGDPQVIEIISTIAPYPRFPINTRMRPLCFGGCSSRHPTDQAVITLFRPY